MTSESDSEGDGRGEQTIDVGRTVADDEAVALPVVEVLWDVNLEAIHE